MNGPPMDVYNDAYKEVLICFWVISNDQWSDGWDEINEGG